MVPLGAEVSLSALLPSEIANRAFKTHPFRRTQFDDTPSAIQFGKFPGSGFFRELTFFRRGFGCATASVQAEVVKPPLSNILAKSRR